MHRLPKLKVIRERKGLTVRQLAAKAGVGSNTVTLLENQPRAATETTIKKIADALGVTPFELARWTSWDEMSEEEQENDFLQEDEAFRRLMWLSDEMLHWHSLKALDEERRRGMKPASIEELEQMERERKPLYAYKRVFLREVKDE